MPCPVQEGWASYPTALLLPLLQSAVLEVGQLPDPALNFPGPNFPGPPAPACGHVMTSQRLSAPLRDGVLNA